MPVWQKGHVAEPPLTIHGQWELKSGKMVMRGEGSKRQDKSVANEGLTKPTRLTKPTISNPKAFGKNRNMTTNAGQRLLSNCQYIRFNVQDG
jgi:hypothetical protein